MTLHSLVLRRDSFSCHCNSIIPSLSIVIQEQFSHFSSIVTIIYIPVNFQCIFSSVIHLSSYMCSNVSRSTRINSSNVTFRLIEAHYDNSTCIVGYLFQGPCTEIFWSIVNIRGPPKGILQQGGINRNVTFFCQNSSLKMGGTQRYFCTRNILETMGHCLMISMTIK